MSRVLLFLGLLLGVAGCSREAVSRADAPAPVGVHTSRVIATTLPVLTTVSGTVRPVRRAAIAARITGTISALPVSLGQRVAAGELLVQLSAEELGARVAQAETQLAQARRELARETALLASGSGTGDAVKNLTERVTIAEATLREAQTNLGYTSLRAPFAGTIARKPAYVGDLATPGVPLLELEGDAEFEIEAPVPDSLTRTLRRGDALDVTRNGGAFGAAVSEISSAADPVDRNVLVKLAVPTGTRVLSGEFVRVAIPCEAATVLLAPANAITSFGQMERVFVVTADKTAGLRLVKTGARRGGQIEILAGLDAGEMVVTDPPAPLRDEQPLLLLP